MKFSVWLFLVISAANVSCIHLGGYSEDITVVTLNIGTQHDSDILNSDWSYRRERLLYLRALLAESLPQIFLMQGAVNRISNARDSDQKILEQSSLRQHKVVSTVVRTLIEAHEKESLLGFYDFNVLSQRQIDFGDKQSFAQVVVLDSKDGPFTVYNVQIISGDALISLFRDIINQQLCPERFIIAGHIEGATLSRYIYENDFKDSSDEFCFSDDCMTTIKQNPLNQAFYPDVVNARHARVFVHKDTRVMASERTFIKEIEAPFLLKRRGLGKMSVGQDYGWMSRIKLPRCR